MKTIPFNDLKTQYNSLKPILLKRVERVLEHGQYIMGPEVRELEDVLSKYVGVKHCITASSGTDTLLLSLLAIGIQPGDEVITTPFSYFATVEMIAIIGAKPIFADIDPKTFNIDANKIAEKISNRTKAIMPVSLFGQCPDMDHINKIAKEHSLVVIEDAAQSFGAKYKDRNSCGLSDIGSTSFFPSKPLGGYGDGGALFTNNDYLAEKMKQLRVHGQKKKYYHEKIGINGRLDTIQAAILLSKMERFKGEVEKREIVASRYFSMIKESCPTVVLPTISSFNSSVFAQFTISLDNREKIIIYLKGKGIPTTIYYPICLHEQEAIKKLKLPSTSLPNAEKASKKVLSLPMSPDLDFETQKYIVQNLRKAIEMNK